MSATIARHKPVLTNAVLGTILFVIVEAMFFSALISSYIVLRAGAGLRWIPPSDVRLPVAMTTINTVFLLISGMLMVLATLWFAKSDAKARWAFLGAMGLGTVFILVQGQEWIKLMGLGMTMVSGVFGASFFLLIGMHGLHALSAVLVMMYVWSKMEKGILRLDQMQAMLVYWSFIVGIWPVLYSLVYF